MKTVQRLTAASLALVLAAPASQAGPVVRAPLSASASAAPLALPPLAPGLNFLIEAPASPALPMPIAEPASGSEMPSAVGAAPLSLQAEVQALPLQESLSAALATPDAAAAAGPEQDPLAPAGPTAQRLGQSARNGQTARAYDGARGPAFLPEEPGGSSGPAVDAFPALPEAGVSFEQVYPASPRGLRRLFSRETPVALPGDPKDEEGLAASLLELVRSDPSRFGGVSADALVAASVRLVAGREGLATMAYAAFQQTVNGLPVEGATLQFTAKQEGGRWILAGSSARLFPAVSVPDSAALPEADLLRRARERLGPGAGAAELERLDRRVMHAGGAWRTLEFFADPASGRLLAVDVASGEAFAWNPRLSLRTEGTAAGRGVRLDPVKTGANLDVLPLGFLEIRTAQGRSFFADAQGRFTLEGEGEGPISFTVRLSGTYAAVKSETGADLVLTGTARPGERVQVLFNPNGADERAVAQVNAYYHVTKTVEFLKSRGVSHEAIDRVMTINVNKDDECNAFYDYRSLNTFLSSAKCINTAFDTVLVHEYGHHWHLTAPKRLAAGLGARLLDAKLRALSTGSMSEGWGDILAMYLSGQPVLGGGFFKDRTEKNWIRHGENDYQYRRGDEVHKEGQAWMGFAWKLRKSLAAALGEARGAAVAEALVLPVVFTGTTDIPAAIRQVLLRDNGEHRERILAAARAHGIDAGGRSAEGSGLARLFWGLLRPLLG